MSSSSDGESSTLSQQDGKPGSYKIFVGGLSWETDEESLRAYFGQFGNVSDCVIMRDRQTKHPRGFGFLSYDSVEAANCVASQMHVLDGRSVEAKHAVPRSDNSQGTSSARPEPPRAPSSDAGGAKGADDNNRASATPPNTKKLFVGGLPAQCRNDELREHFSAFGTVTDAQVLIDHKTGNSRGFGFVTFGEDEAVERVMGSSQTSCHREILGKTVEIKRAEPKQVLDARRSGGRGEQQSAPNARANTAMAYAASFGLMHMTPLLASQYAGYYHGLHGWPQYAVPHQLSSSPPVGYFWPPGALPEFNPYGYDASYDPAYYSAASGSFSPQSKGVSGESSSPRKVSKGGRKSLATDRASRSEGTA